MISDLNLQNISLKLILLISILLLTYYNSYYPNKNIIEGFSSNMQRLDAFQIAGRFYRNLRPAITDVNTGAIRLWDIVNDGAVGVNNPNNYGLNHKYPGNYVGGGPTIARARQSTRGAASYISQYTNAIFSAAGVAAGTWQAGGAAMSLSGGARLRHSQFMLGSNYSPQTVLYEDGRNGANTIPDDVLSEVSLITICQTIFRYYIDPIYPGNSITNQPANMDQTLSGTLGIALVNNDHITVDDMWQGGNIVSEHILLQMITQNQNARVKEDLKTSQSISYAHVHLSPFLEFVHNALGLTADDYPSSENIDFTGFNMRSDTARKILPDPWRSDNNETSWFWYYSPRQCEEIYNTIKDHVRTSNDGIVKISTEMNKNDARNLRNDIDHLCNQNA